MKKKVLGVLCAMTMVGAMLAGCGSAAAESKQEEKNVSEKSEEAEEKSEETAEEVEKEDLIVFAAASMTETLSAIKLEYEKDHPEVNIVFTFGSSGDLKTQIAEGAEADIFISAGQKQMNQLDINADPEINTDGLDYVIEETRFNILENKVVLAVPDDNSADIQTFDDLAEALKAGNILFAMGNSDVPVGQYTQKILAYYELNEEELANSGVITYGNDVKEVTSQVSEGTVDAGVIYSTDAFSAGLKVVDEATKEMCGQIIYPAAVLKTVHDREAADAFMEYLKEDTASEIFESVGFTVVK